MTDHDSSRQAPAAIFDLDGVLTDTAELHFQSWVVVARDLGVKFDREKNEALRGVTRMISCDLMLGEHAGDFSDAQKRDIADRKNEEYRGLVARMTPADLFDGAHQLLCDLRKAGLGVALASASKNGQLVVDRLQIGDLFDAVVDGNDIKHSKPDPEVFLTAAGRLRREPARCVVVEDAAAGVEAGLAAGMAVIGIGPPARVGRAHHVVSGVHELAVEDFRRLVELR